MDHLKYFEIKNEIKIPRISPERWEELKHFRLRRDDVFIVSFPKSGSTWTQQIVKLLRNGGQPDDIKIDRAILWLEILDSDFGKVLGYTRDMGTSSDILCPRVFKNHLPYELVPGGLPHITAAKYIYVMRNPKDVCVSYWYYLNNYGPKSWEDHVTVMLSEVAPYGGWFTHVLGWRKHKDSPNILYIKYEDMKTDPLTAISTVANFIGVDNVTDELLQNVLKHSSFLSMKKDSTSNYNWLFGPGKPIHQARTPFIRKGDIGGWKEHFTEEQSKRFDEIYQKQMSGVDLQLCFE